MRKTSLTFAVLLALPMVHSDLVWAHPKTHRPWFSKNVSSPSAEVSSNETQDTAPVAEKNIATKSDKGTQVADQALRYKGTRYRYGGTTKHGMDCSGLVARVWSDLKMKKIPRASSALYHSGKPVHLEELRAGDLVFFKNTYKPGISHVGVYAGNNKFVHASGHRRGVTITKLSDPYYQLHYAGARRLY